MTESGLHIRFVEMNDRKKDLENQLKVLKEEMQKVEAILIEQFLDDENQIRKISIKGGATLRLDCKIWPKVSSSEEAVEALRSAGMSQLLARETYQVQSLAAFLRECDANETPLPDSFKGVISPNPVYKIIVTRN